MMNYDELLQMVLDRVRTEVTIPVRTRSIELGVMLNDPRHAG